MKKSPPPVFKIGSKVVCVLPDARGADGTIVGNKGVFGSRRKQLWAVRFQHAEYDLFEESLRLKEEK